MSVFSHTGLLCFNCFAVHNDLQAERDRRRDQVGVQQFDRTYRPTLVEKTKKRKEKKKKKKKKRKKNNDLVVHLHQVAI